MDRSHYQPMSTNSNAQAVNSSAHPCLQSTLNCSRNWFFLNRSFAIMVKCTCVLKPTCTRARVFESGLQTQPDLCIHNFSPFKIECDSDMENMSFCVFGEFGHHSTRIRFVFPIRQTRLSCFSEQKKQQKKTSISSPITFADIIIISISEVLRDAGLVCVFGKRADGSAARTPLSWRGSTALTEERLQSRRV